jgi:hypothetical protein
MHLTLLTANFMLFISVRLISIAKQSQLMHSIIVCLFIAFCSSSPRHVSASDYAIIKGAISNYISCA